MNHSDMDGRQAIPGAIVGGISGAIGAALTGGLDPVSIGLGFVVGAGVGSISAAAGSRAGAIAGSMSGNLIAAAGAGAASTLGQILGNLREDSPAFCGFSIGAVAGSAIGAGYSASFVSSVGYNSRIGLMLRGVAPRYAGAGGRLAEGLADGVVSAAGETVGAVLQDLILRAASR